MHFEVYRADGETWEGSRFTRGPRVGFELIFAWDQLVLIGQLLAYIGDWRSPGAGFALAATNPRIACLIHFVAPFRFHGRIGYRVCTYETPPLSRPRSLARWWEIGRRCPPAALHFE